MKKYLIFLNLISNILIIDGGYFKKIINLYSSYY